jgi:hypothetical protein
MTVYKNKEGTSLFFSNMETFACVQCPARFPDPQSPFKGSVGVTLQCVAEWCPVFAWHLPEAEEYDDGR